MASRSWIFSIASRDRWVTSMCVTPAYLRSAFPGGQHMSSTLENPALWAKLNTCSRVYSGTMAETNPSFMVKCPTYKSPVRNELEPQNAECDPHQQPHHVRGVGDRPEQAGHAKHQPEEHRGDRVGTQDHSLLRLVLPLHPEIAEKGVYHARQATKKVESPGVCLHRVEVLAQVGKDRRDQHEHRQAKRAPTALDHRPFHGHCPDVEQDVPDAEMQEDRRHEPPDFARQDRVKAIAEPSTLGIEVRGGEHKRAHYNEAQGQLL